MLKKMATTLILVGSLTLPLRAQPAPKLPPETHNAALRYWMAFAEMQDPPSDKETTDLLEKTAAGETPWQEAKLGPILDKNETAIQIMQRATKLPDCDWGFEYSRGAATSVAYVPRARVLARLNTLYGMRLAAKGDSERAVETWLAGIRFSQHLAKGGSLLATLIGRMALLSSLHALTQTAEQGTLSPAEKAVVAAAVKALPQTGFDWGQALFYEQLAIEVEVQAMKASPNPDEYYQQLMGRPAPVNPANLSPADAAAFTKVMSAAEDAMRLPPAQTGERLAALQKSLDALHPIYLQMTPSFSKTNQSRNEVAAAREKLLGLMAQK